MEKTICIKQLVRRIRRLEKRDSNKRGKIDLTCFGCVGCSMFPFLGIFYTCNDCFITKCPLCMEIDDDCINNCKGNLSYNGDRSHLFRTLLKDNGIKETKVKGVIRTKGMITPTFEGMAKLVSKYIKISARIFQSSIKHAVHYTDDSDYIEELRSVIDRISIPFPYVVGIVKFEISNDLENVFTVSSAGKVSKVDMIENCYTCVNLFTMCKDIIQELKDVSGINYYDMVGIADFECDSALEKIK